MAPAKPAPGPKPAGEPEPEEPVPSPPLSGLGDDSLEGLRAAFSGLSVGGPEGKEEEKKKEAVAMGAEEVDPVESEPVESAPSASDYSAVLSATTTTFPATHPATSSPTTTPPMAEGLGFTGMPYPTYSVTPAATVPPMATAVGEPVASSSTLFLSLCRAALKMTITDPRRPCTGLGYLAMRHPSLAILCQHLVSPL